MAKKTLNGLAGPKIIAFCVLAMLFHAGKGACTNVTPNYTYTQSKSCGVPVVITFTNTSTGANQNIATYSWYVGTTLIKSAVGKAGASYTITAAGSYTFKLVARDTGAGGCRDSVSQTITISPVITRIRETGGTYSYAPLWENCISSFGTPDTFGLTFQTQDSLKNYTIIWGDGSSNASGSLLLSTQTLYHKYNALGLYYVKIIGVNGSCRDTLQGLVVNERNPVAGLIGPPTGTSAGCVPIRMRFVNNSSISSPSSSFTWEMGDGSVITQPASTYNDTFYYTYRRFLCNGVVKLTMTNACGSSFSTWNPIQASSKDTAIINIGNPSNCDLAQDFLFNNYSQNRFCSSPNPKKYFWNFGDGTNSGWTSSTSTIAKKYTQRGTFNITLIDSNSCGKDTARYTLIIDSLPNIRANAINNSGCAPLTVYFRDSSTGATSRTWNFGDGSATTTTQNIAHTYSTGGTYQAILSVSNACSTLRDTFNITVNAKVDAGIQSISGARCLPYTANFVNTSTIPFPGQTTFKWIFEDGSTSFAQTPPARNYNTAGNHQITLVAYDGCGTDTARTTLQIVDKPPLNVSLVSAVPCDNAPAVLRYTTALAGSTIYWNHADGSSISQFTGYTQYDHTHVFDSVQTYMNIIVIVDPYGCRDTAELNVDVQPGPDADFTLSTAAGCGPLGVTFTNSSQHNGGGTFSQLQFQWSYGNASSTKADSSIVYSASKTKDSIYNPKLVVTNSFGCKDSISKSVRVYPDPLSRFTDNNSSGCGPLGVNLTNTSIPNDTGSIYIMQFNWNLGNGTTSTARNIATIYPASLTKDTLFNVRLIAQSEHGCLDTSNQNIRVYPKPIAAYTPLPGNGCRPLTVNFQNNSDPQDTGSIAIMTFEWNLGNTVTSTLTNPSTIYTDIVNKDTNYLVQLIAKSEHGCRDTATGNVVLHPNATVGFNATQYAGCAPFTPNLNNTSINAISYTWQFGNFYTSNATEPVVALQGKPIFDSTIVVRLSAISTFGCPSDTVSRTFTIYGSPVADYAITEDTFCFPEAKQFFNQSLTALSYEWNLGDGTITTTTNPTHYFQKHPNPFEDTTYQMYLVARNARGCTDTTRGTMTVFPYPVPRFANITDGCSPHTATMNNTSINAYSYHWDFGDGFTSSAQNPTHTFVNNSIRDTAYKVVLYAYSLDCVDTISQWVSVHRPSYSLFRAERIAPCDAGYFQFTDFSDNAPSVLYKFGDGSTSTQRNPIHLFQPSPYQDTSYTITLITTSIYGCTDSFKRAATLPQRLQMGIKDTAFFVCHPATVQFISYTKGAAQYLWNFGDYLASVDANPLHEYTKPGIYNYKLYAFDANGCMDSAIATNVIRVNESPIAGFTINPKTGRMPANNIISFTNTSTSSVPITFRWDFTDPAGAPPTSTAQNPTHTFSDSGNYTVCLEVNNSACGDTFCLPLRIEPAFPIADFTNDRDSGCPALSVRFTNNSSYAATYMWYFGDGEKSTETNPTHVYRFPGYYDVSLVAYGPGGEDKLEKKFLIHVLESPFSMFSVTPSVVYLPEGQFYTRNQSSGATSYNWNVYKTNPRSLARNSNDQHPVFKLSDTGYYDVELISSNSTGCTDTMVLRRSVYVNPKGIMHVPDAFTPTDDGRNDVFIPSTYNIQEGFYTFQVFNRWGEMVFETNNPYEGWDGTNRGVMCMSGVYAYKIKARHSSGNEASYEGIVHLMR